MAAIALKSSYEHSKLKMVLSKGGVDLILEDILAVSFYVRSMQRLLYLGLDFSSHL